MKLRVCAIISRNLHCSTARLWSPVACGISTSSIFGPEEEHITFSLSDQEFVPKPLSYPHGYAVTYIKQRNSPFTS